MHPTYVCTSAFSQLSRPWNKRWPLSLKKLVFEWKRQGGTKESLRQMMTSTPCWFCCLYCLLLVLLPIKPMTLNMLDIAYPQPHSSMEWRKSKWYWLCSKCCSSAKYSHYNLVVHLCSSGKDWSRDTFLSHLLWSHILFHVSTGPLLQLLYLCYSLVAFPISLDSLKPGSPPNWKSSIPMGHLGSTHQNQEPAPCLGGFIFLKPGFFFYTMGVMERQITNIQCYNK